MRFTLVTLALLAALVCYSNPAQADDWTKTDIAIEATVGALLIADYLQTVKIIRDPVMPGHRESNPIMGHNGEKMSPELYFPLVALAHVAVAEVLPSRWRKVWAGVAIVVQVDSVRHNWQNGYTASYTLSF